MKKIFIFLLIAICLISGCSFNVEVVTPPAAQSDSTLPASTIATPIATISATAELPLVGFTPVTSDPIFYAASVSLDQSGVPARIAFPTGTKQIFAVWHYQNMREGLTIKREWYLNGEPWLFREDPWDFEKYGASGIMKDVSIYDLDAGLPSGLYQLKIYIDYIQQPIGVNTASGPEMFLIFEILRAGETSLEAASPDSKWSAEVTYGNRIVIRNETGMPTQIFVGREIPYISWFPDSQHFLFVDRDRSQQQQGSPIGVRDDLWIADVFTGKTNLLYKSDTAFGRHGGPIASPDGKYIASLEGSGFADACMVDSRLIFFELASDWQSMRVIKQEQFSGIPASNDGVVYPREDGVWEADNLYRVTLDGTCSVDQNQLGPYVFNISALKATKSSSASTPPILGDLGWGSIHGKIVDAVTGEPIVGATVTCQHSSYTSPATCSGSTTTDAQGMYIFGNIFFHDTDTVKLTVQAAGYQSQEITQSASTFPMADMERDLSLSKVQQ